MAKQTEAVGASLPQAPAEDAPNRRLSLKRETLQRLTKDELSAVAGGKQALNTFSTGREAGSNR